MARSARWIPLAAAAAVAAMLTGAAAVTAEQAGCTDPGTWVVGQHGAQLVGGCLDREELPIVPLPAEPGPEQPTRLGD